MSSPFHIPPLACAGRFSLETPEVQPETSWTSWLNPPHDDGHLERVLSWDLDFARVLDAVASLLLAVKLQRLGFAVGVDVLSRDDCGCGLHDSDSSMFWACSSAIRVFSRRFSVCALRMAARLRFRSRSSRRMWLCHRNTRSTLSGCLTSAALLP